MYIQGSLCNLPATCSTQQHYTDEYALTDALYKRVNKPNSYKLVSRFNCTCNMKLNLILLVASMAEARVAPSKQMGRICNHLNNYSSQAKKAFNIRYPNLMNFCRQMNQQKHKVNVSVAQPDPDTYDRQAFCDIKNIKTWQYSVLC